VEKREAERENLLRGYIIIDVDCASIKDGQLSRRPRCPDTVPIHVSIDVHCKKYLEVFI
jgi:hypothetical protein